MKNSKGLTTTLALIFGTVFIILITSLSSFIIVRLKQSREKTAWNEALQIAESGVSYYQWYLIHSPENYDNYKNFCCDAPPCEICDYSDAQKEIKGKFKLEVNPTIRCGQISTLSLISTGWLDDYPDKKRKIKVEFIKPTIADYAALIDNDVWAGSDREIKGPYHSNGGVRMDGENKSIVSSSKSDWICGLSLGCCADPCQWDEEKGCYSTTYPWSYRCPYYSCPSPCNWEENGCQCPGVFTTANGEETFFRFPSSYFDFNGITIDLNAIKNLTKNNGREILNSGQVIDHGESGIYISPSEEEGYYIVINHNKIDVYKITSLSAVRAYSSESGSYYWEYSIIENKEFLGSYTLSDSCNLLFVEDDLWIEGEIEGKLTVVSGDLISASKETNIWITGDLLYTTRDGSDGLFLLAQHNNLIHPQAAPLNGSNELNGIFMAQTGHFGINHYKFLDLKFDGFGLDVSDVSLKIAKLEKKDGFFNLVSYGEKSFEKGVIKRGG